MSKKKKREYYRICGICGEKYSQKEMRRDDSSDTGWVCEECYSNEFPEYDIDEW